MQTYSANCSAKINWSKLCEARVLQVQYIEKVQHNKKNCTKTVEQTVFSLYLKQRQRQCVSSSDHQNKQSYTNLFVLLVWRWFTNIYKKSSHSLFSKIAAKYCGFHFKTKCEQKLLWRLFLINSETWYSKSIILYLFDIYETVVCSRGGNLVLHTGSHWYC